MEHLTHLTPRLTPRLTRLAAAAAVVVVVLLLTWLARPGRGAERFSEDEDSTATIFVSIASYRDSDCLETLKSLFSTAANPGRVFAGVCEQNTKSAEEVCLPSEFKWHDQVRRLSVPSREAKGPTYARYLCSTLYRGETYFCQVDSHTRFVEGWDAKAVAMLKGCSSKKPVLTHYPHDWDQIRKKAAAPGGQVPVLCKSKFDTNGVPTFDAVTMQASDTPRPVPFTSGGFVFGPGTVLTEVPYDPDLPQLFQGEEILYSARLWTSGYDFFTPTENLAFHHYYREEAPKFWADIDFSEQQGRTLAKVKKLLRGRLPGYSHGMGTVRTLDEYYEFAGLDWESKTSTSEAKFCAEAPA